jgi:hypothetical protein
MRQLFIERRGYYINTGPARQAFVTFASAVAEKAIVAEYTAGKVLEPQISTPLLY